MDKLNTECRSENMRRIRSKDTKPEVLLRSLLHKQGYRFRVHRKDLPGNPDIVLTGRRKVIFVHGCFWHQHTGCREGRLPSTKQDYWRPKLKRNVDRDAAAIDEMKKLGWDVAVVWECELDKRQEEVLDRITAFLGEPGQQCTRLNLALEVENEVGG